MTEDQLLTAIIGPGCNNLADLYGWVRVHFRPAKTVRGYRTALQGDTGFPDLVLVRDRVLWRELKSDTGILSPEQHLWFQALKRAGQDVDVWRPKDWDRIVREMK